MQKKTEHSEDICVGSITNENLLNTYHGDVGLISDSIYNNIKIGNPLASKLQIIHAAEKAMVLDFAWELPKGLDTFVDDERYPLSTEQKKSINLARILLKANT